MTEIGNLLQKVHTVPTAILTDTLPKKNALSRVFFADRDFVILDEPSASLDVFAEEKIFHQFQQLSGTRSSIIISHRLSSIVAADKILVLKNGRILEQGKHRELLSKNGYYSELFYAQAQSYR